MSDLFKCGLLKKGLFLLTFILTGYLTGLWAVLVAQAAPAAPTNLTATAISGDRINLTWQDNSTDESSFKVEMDAGYGFNQIGTTGANVIAYQATVYEESKSYSFRVRAYGNYTNSPYSNTASATSLLKTPTNLTATAKSSTKIDLTWTDNSNQESNYVVERKQGADDWETIATLAANTKSYSDTSCQPETAYGYRVKATQSSPANNSAYSNEATATTQAIKILPEPNLVGFFSDLGTVNDIVLSPDGNKAYVASDPFGLVILDVSNRAQPKLYGSLSSQHPYGKANSVAISGNLAIVTGTPRGSDLVDISDPAYPKVLSSVSGSSSGVAISGNYAYIASAGDLKVVDISNPYNPNLKTTVVTPGGTGHVTIAGNLAVVDDNTNVVTVNITTPESASISGTLNLNGYLGKSAITTIEGTLYALVANGSLGTLQIVNLSDPAHPTLDGSISTGSAFSVTTEGNFAYVSANSYGLVIIDISTPSAPQKKGAYRPLNATFNPNSSVVINGIAYMASGAGGVWIANVTNPAAPTLLGSVKQQTTSNHVAVSNNLAVLTGTSRGTDLVDISNPTSPQIMSSIEGFSSGVAISGDYAYIAAAGDLKVVNITNPASPQEKITVVTPGVASDVAISGNLAVVSDSFNGLTVVDISHPDTAYRITSFPLDGYVGGVSTATINNKLYALVANGSLGTLQIVNLSDPAHPTLDGSISTGSAFSVTTEGNFAYVSANSYGLVIIDISTPSAPEKKGAYRPINATFNPNSAVVINGLAYMASGSTGVWLADVSDPTNIKELGQVATIGYANTIVFSNDKKYIYTSDLKSEINIFKMYQDLELKKFASVTSARSNDTFTFTLTIKNPSAYAQTNLTLTDAIPAGTAYVVNSATVNGQAVTDAADSDAYKLNSGVPTWTFATVVPSGQTGSIITITFRVKVL